MSSRKNEAVWIEKYNHWRIREQRNGKRKPFYSTIPGKKGKIEAERKADEWLDWLDKGGKPTEMLFDELSKSYIAHIRTANGTAHRSKEEATIRLYLPWNGRKVSSLTLLDYQDAIDACVEGREKPLSARTCGHVRTTINALYKHARKMNVKMQEPLDLTIPTGATKGEKKVLQPEDIKKLFGPAADRYYHTPLIRFIVITGLRPGEACGLKTDDLDGNVLTIQRAINTQGEVTNGKNENARRTLVLPQLALDAIEQHQQTRKEKALISPWLFCNQNGQANSEQTLYGIWHDKMCKKLDIPPVSLYELRHTMISLCKTMPLPLLKQVVGHSKSMDTLGTYGHELDGEREKSAALIAEIFCNITG